MLENSMQKQQKGRIIFEVPIPLKRVFASIISSNGKTQTAVLTKFVEGYVKRSGKKWIQQ